MDLQLRRRVRRRHHRRQHPFRGNGSIVRFPVHRAHRVLALADEVAGSAPKP